MEMKVPMYGSWSISHLTFKITLKIKNHYFSFSTLSYRAKSPVYMIEVESYSTSASITSSSSAFLASGFAPPCSLAYIASASL